MSLRDMGVFSHDEKPSVSRKQKTKVLLLTGVISVAATALGALLATWLLSVIAGKIIILAEFLILAGFCYGYVRVKGILRKKYELNRWAIIAVQNGIPLLVGLLVSVVVNRMNFSERANADDLFLIVFSVSIFAISALGFLISFVHSYWEFYNEGVDDAEL